MKNGSFYEILFRGIKKLIRDSRTLEGFIENFCCILNINKKYDEKITAYFIFSPTFVPTSNILIKSPLQKPESQIEGGVNLIFVL